METTNTPQQWFRLFPTETGRLNRNSFSHFPESLNRLIVVKEWEKYLGKNLNLPKSGGRTATNTNCQEWYTIGQYMCQNSSITRGPLVSANIKWGQERLSSYYSPIGFDACTPPCLKPPSGCGPVAMAQVLWNYFHTSSSNFSSMPMYSYTSYCAPTTTGEDNLAHLMRNCGLAASSIYGISSCNTLTYPWNIPFALQILGLSNGGSTSSFSAITVEQDIYSGNPIILYAKDNIFNWHIWVLDGFQRNDYNQYNCDTHACDSWSYEYFFMNWGWNGNSNGWYASGNFSPNGTSLNYNSGLTMIKGIRK